MRVLLTQLSRFGAVGAVGFVVDVAIFNLLRVTVLSPDVLHEGPVLAKVISTTVAIAVNWIGNRYWTFHRERRPEYVREGLAFALVSVGGMLIALLCLFVSHYVLGFTSLLADNIASNVVGLGLGAVFRFALYRSWVFTGVPRGRGAVGGRACPEISGTTRVSIEPTPGARAADPGDRACRDLARTTTMGLDHRARPPRSSTSSTTGSAYGRPRLR